MSTVDFDLRDSMIRLNAICIKEDDQALVYLRNALSCMKIVFPLLDEYVIVHKDTLKGTK